jgi:hypothetical protein
MSIERNRQRGKERVDVPMYLCGFVWICVDLCGLRRQKEGKGGQGSSSNEWCDEWEEEAHFVGCNRTQSIENFNVVRELLSTLSTLSTHCIPGWQKQKEDCEEMSFLLGLLTSPRVPKRRSAKWLVTIFSQKRELYWEEIL